MHDYRYRFLWNRPRRDMSFVPPRNTATTQHTPCTTHNNTTDTISQARSFHHFGELNHALSEVGGPTQAQQSRPMSSNTTSWRKHLQLNSDANASNETYVKEKKERRGKTRKQRKTEKKQGKHEKYSKMSHPRPQHRFSKKKTSFLRQELPDNSSGLGVCSDD